MIPALNAWVAEEAAINGYPPLKLVVLGDWLLRFSGGARRTANSATLLREPQRPIEGDMEAVIATAEALYREQGLPPIFRLPSFLDPAIDAQLAAHGYTAEGDSCIIEGPIDPIIAAAEAFGGGDAVRLEPRPADDWFAAMARLQGQQPGFHVFYRQIVGSVALPAAFAALAVDGAPVALAYGVIHRGMLCFESVVTDTRHRRKGYSRRVLAALGSWAKRQGVGMATLQVEASNTPGRTLYDAIGMTTELHRYHYRRAPS
ncbi:MAG TPA: GNAT family N-acetyltransferase [Stellaceae bacterium]|nr:GNAT family N-acetyltransferase [Stellaceae bacterium]